MDQRVSFITLGVEDVERANRFYEALGWKGSTPDGDVYFFQAGGIVFSLWNRAKLAEDSGVSDSGGSSGFTLAFNTRTRNEVDEIAGEVRAAGGTITREPGETFWGGYSCAFTDPDGHPWEVAFGSHYEITADGQTKLKSPE